ncbi:hypothetical protein [Bradyrhizobium sp. BWA-3-5]|uniref:hypothetical protein n=1 Tax=Bradyrhizobium sp. BWA-3-5 TaxID=3080013 RepID=UPI00293E135A|nr:hypothetical protein [Bradyrhizobium sp. BWA-3-5]WOH64133.1 hypothetical protein RX331_26530 [Bradyrhizobium sp. BWA-3-5]WOH64250.1 hypothetical protein RX331_27270 [Bradyrhizobium sp. BWA-3-5]WOH70178.1 hypothetical protein RX331_38450 [Bradyrhizobium sp. BWA-3-5]
MSIVEIVATTRGGRSVLGEVIRSQADLALAVRKQLPLTALHGLAKAGLTEQEIELFVIPQRTSSMASAEARKVDVSKKLRANCRRRRKTSFESR